MPSFVQVLQRDNAVLVTDHAKPIQERTQDVKTACGFALLVSAKKTIEVLVVIDFVVGDMECNCRQHRILADEAQGSVKPSRTRLYHTARCHLAGARRL